MKNSKSRKRGVTAPNTKKTKLQLQEELNEVQDALKKQENEISECRGKLQQAEDELANLKETLGDKLIFIGGMDSSVALNFGTVQDVVDDVKKCIKAAGEGGGYIAGPSHNILNSPWENVIAMRDAILKYRRYPLK